MNEFIQHTINGLALGSIYALVALGYTMVFGVLQLINFAHGDIFMMGSFIGLYFIRYAIPNAEPSIFTAIMVIVAAMVGSAALGAIIEKFAYRPLRKAPRINILITAIGVSLLLEYGGQLVFGASPQFFPDILPRKLIDIGGDIILDSNQLTIFIMSFVLMQILSFLVFKTQFGRSMRAISHSLETANLIGINVNKVILITFLIGSALAGAAGVLYGVAYPKIDPLLGLLPGLKAFIAAVLGGMNWLATRRCGANGIGPSRRRPISNSKRWAHD